MINAIDKQILNILQENARTSNAEIARQVGLAPSAVFERIRKLEERRIIRGYRADIDPKVLGLAQLAFTFVRSNDRPGGVETGEKLAEIPEILEVHHVAGEDCFLIKARARLGAIATIASTRTTIVLETVKETAALPLPAEAAFEDEEAASA